MFSIQMAYTQIITGSSMNIIYRRKWLFVIIHKNILLIEKEKQIDLKL